MEQSESFDHVPDGVGSVGATSPDVTEPKVKTGWMVLAVSTAMMSLDSSATSRVTHVHPFDLGVKSVEVTEKQSSSMFRRVRVQCVIANYGPGVAPSKIRIRLTRPKGEQRKVVRDIVTKYQVSPGKSFFIAGEDTVWRTAMPSYRCAIDYGPPGARTVVGDVNPENDVGQSPQLK